MIGVGEIIGMGAFVLTGVVAANNSGPAVILSFLLAAVVAGFAALCYAELVSLLPIAGVCVWVWVCARLCVCVSVCLHLCGINIQVSDDEISGLTYLINITMRRLVLLLRVRGAGRAAGLDRGVGLVRPPLVCHTLWCGILHVVSLCAVHFVSSLACQCQTAEC